MVTPLRFWLALVVATAAIPVRADWEFVPRAGLRVEADNNVFLEPVNEESDTRGVLDVGAILQNYGQRGNFFVEPVASLYRYSKPENEILDSDDIRINTGGAFGWRTVEIGFRSIYADQSIIQAELTDAIPDDPDVDQPPEGDTGRVENIQQQREWTYFGPYVEFSISDRNRFRVGIDRSDSDYSLDTPGAQRSEYDSTTLSTQLLRRIDDRTQVSARLYVGEYNASETSNHTENFGVEGTFARPLSETWDWDMTVGLVRTDYEYIDQVTRRPVVNAASDVSAGMNFRKRSARSVWNMSLSHTVVPNGSGYMVEVQEIWVYLEQRFTERFEGEFGVIAFRSRTLDSASVLDDRNYASLTLGFEYALKQRLFLRFGMNSDAQEFINENEGVATGSMLYFGIAYRGLSRTDQ